MCGHRPGDIVQQGVIPEDADPLSWNNLTGHPMGVRNFLDQVHAHNSSLLALSAGWWILGKCRMLWGPSSVVLRFLFPQGVGVRQLLLIHLNQLLQHSRILSLLNVRDSLVDTVRNHEHVATVDPPSQKSYIRLRNLSRAFRRTGATRDTLKGGGVSTRSARESLVINYCWVIYTWDLNAGT